MMNNIINKTINTLRGFKGVIITPFGAKKPTASLRGVTPLRPPYGFIGVDI